MGRSQWIAAGVTALLVLVTYWGCPVGETDAAAGLKNAPVAATGLESLIRAVRDELTPVQIATLANLEERLELAENSATEPVRPLQEKLASEWFRAGHPAISGVYARQIAEESNEAEDWGIAATTFSLCLQKEGADDKTLQFCSAQAEESYQAAISLDPEDVDARINLAVSYTDYPPANEPMKGIMMLIDLAKKNPENARVNITLGQLSVKTGQLDNAAKRYAMAAELEPNNPDAVCPLAKVYEQLGEAEKAVVFIDRCKELLNVDGESR